MGKKKSKTKREVAREKNTGELKFSEVIITVLAGLVLAIWLFIKLH